jgi:hypothetical protein
VKKLSKKFIQPVDTRGDMIIEVLLALVMIAIVLTAGYVLSHRGLQSSTNSDLRSQAQSLAQSQIEQMINTQNTDALQLSRYTIDRPFCILPNGDIRDANPNAGVCPNYNNDKNIGVGVIYNSAAKTFTISAKWNIVKGDPVSDPSALTYKDEVTLYYRLPVSFTSTSLALNAYIRGTGKGTVTGGGLNCTNTGSSSNKCFVAYSSPQVVALSAKAGADSKFQYWSGDCTGSNSTCIVNVNKLVYVSANFEQVTSTPPPTVDIDLGSLGADGFKPTNVWLYGKVNPNGNQLTKCYFRFSLNSNLSNSQTLTFDYTPGWTHDDLSRTTHRNDCQGFSDTTTHYIAGSAKPYSGQDATKCNPKSSAGYGYSCNGSLGKVEKTDAGVPWPNSGGLTYGQTVYFKFCVETSTGLSACSIQCHLRMNSTTSQDGEVRCP